jgi:hypothetical protein
MKKKFLSLGLVFCLVVSLFPTSLMAVFADGSFDNEYAVENPVQAQFDYNENKLYVASPRSQDVPLSTVFMFNTETNEVIDAPFFLGDVTKATEDGLGGFFVFGDFKYAQDVDNLPIQEANQNGTSLAYIDRDGKIDNIVELETDGQINDMFYVNDHQALFIAGDFATVNGEPHNSIACINPITGEFCIIDEYDWSDNTGFFTENAFQVDIDYDPYEQVLLLNGNKDQKYAESDPYETAITVLDIANPTANIAPTYFGPEVDMEFRGTDNGVQILYVDTKNDLDANEFNEQVIIAYNGVRAWIYYNNGADYVSNTQFSLLGVQDAKFFVRENTVNTIYFSSYTFSNDPYEISLNRVPVSYNPGFGGSFSFSMSFGLKELPILDNSTFNSDLFGAVVDEQGDVFFAGNFNYEVSGQRNYSSFVGLDEEDSFVYAGNAMSKNIVDLDVSNENVLLVGDFQLSSPEVANRGILKFDSNGNLDTSFDFEFLDFNDEPTEITRFKIIGDYLYIFGSDSDIARVYDVSEDAYTNIPNSNLLRINVLTGNVDADFDISEVYNGSVSNIYYNEAGLFYVVGLFSVNALNTSFEAATEFNTNFSDISIDTVYNSVTDSSGNLYLILDLDDELNERSLYKISPIGVPTLLNVSTAYDTLQTITYTNDKIYTSYLDDNEVKIQVVNPETGDLDVSVDFGRYSFVNNSVEPRISSLEKIGDKLFVTGNFKSLLDYENEVVNNLDRLAIFDLATGDYIPQTVFDGLYQLSEDAPLKIAYNYVNSKLAFYGNLSFNRAETVPSLVGNPFGMYLTNYGEVNEITVTRPVPTITTIEDAFMEFEVTGTRESDPLATSCGFGAEVIIGDERVNFELLEVGKTYECEFVYNSIFGNSNTVQIGPFTVVESYPRNGGGGGGSGSRASKEVEMTYEEEVGRVLALGIVTKDPKNVTNKCEALVMMERVFEWEVPVASGTKYTDVPAWCTNVAAFGTTRGIVEGRAVDRLGMETPVTRDEVALMIYRELKLQKYVFKGTTVVEFTDAPLTSWANEAIEALAKESIIKGFADGSFGGQKSILKQDLGVMLLRLK